MRLGITQFYQANANIACLHFNGIHKHTLRWGNWIMEDTNLLVSKQPDDPEGNPQINIPKAALGEFLSGLLGQPRSTTKTLFQNFEIDHAFLCNLDTIINQRIVSHQEATLASFHAVIEFKGNRSEVVNSRDAFISFNDLSDSATRKVTMSWLYLVKFPQKSVPENKKLLFQLTLVGRGNVSPLVPFSLLESLCFMRCSWANLK
jgi:hypothetical protein